MKRCEGITEQDETIFLQQPNHKLRGFLLVLEGQQQACLLCPESLLYQEDEVNIINFKILGNPIQWEESVWAVGEVRNASSDSGSNETDIHAKIGIEERLEVGCRDA